MKRDRSDAGRPGVEFAIGEAVTPALQVFAGELKRMQHGALQSRNISQSSSQPRFFIHVASLQTPRILARADLLVLLGQAARRVHGLAASFRSYPCRFAPNRLPSFIPEILLLPCQPARRATRARRRHPAVFLYGTTKTGVEAGDDGFERSAGFTTGGFKIEE